MHVLFPGRIASADEPRHEHNLSADDRELFEHGSASAAFTAVAIVAAHLAGAGYVVENPFSSAFVAVSMISERIALDSSCVCAHCVFCMGRGLGEADLLRGHFAQA